MDLVSIKWVIYGKYVFKPIFVASIKKSPVNGALREIEI
jgi:hypothetical protein